MKNLTITLLQDGNKYVLGDSYYGDSTSCIKSQYWSKSAKALILFLLAAKIKSSRATTKPGPIVIAEHPYGTKHWLATLGAHVSTKRQTSQLIESVFGGTDIFVKDFWHASRTGGFYRVYYLNNDTYIRFIVRNRDSATEILHVPKLLEIAKSIRNQVPKWSVFSVDEPTVSGNSLPETEGTPTFFEVGTNSSSPVTIDQEQGTLCSLTEATWLRHQQFQKPYAESVSEMRNLVAANKLGPALEIYKATLFPSGYHELWSQRLKISNILLSTSIQREWPRDAGYINVMGIAYAMMEQGQFALAKAKIEEAIELYSDSNQHEEGVGRCLRYLGSLYAKQLNIPRALDYKKQALHFSKGAARTEVLAEIELLTIRHVEQDARNIESRLKSVESVFEEIGSWKKWAAKFTWAEALRNRGEIKEALTVTSQIKSDFGTVITMERFRRQVVRFEEDVLRS